MPRNLSGRSLAAVLGAMALAACATTTPSPTWSGDGIHVVDGYWILAELPCDMASSDVCVAEVSAAEASLGIDQKGVVRQATAQLPLLRSIRSDGQVLIYLQNVTGPRAFAVLDLVDGSRRVVGIVCIGVPNPDGSRYCDSVPLDAYRVGASPSY